MKRLALAGLVLACAGPALADEPFEGRGYVIACGEEGCFVNAAGMDLFVPLDAGAERLAGYPMMAAVDLAGTLSDIGDATASLALESAARVADDLHEGNLIALQGDWKPRDEGSPFHIGIYGMDWNEIVMDEVEARFMISVGTACADGTEHKGSVLNLYRYGDDPAADACWLLEYVDDTMLTLRNVGGGGEAVEFDRITP